MLGKGGATISQIRSDSGATVRLVGLDPEEERHLPRDLGSGQHRVISIAGDPDCALRALTAVTDLLQECQVLCLGVCSTVGALVHLCQNPSCSGCWLRSKLAPQHVTRQRYLLKVILRWHLCSELSLFPCVYN